MMDRGYGLGKRIRVGGEGAVDFEDFRDCRGVEVIMGCVVGNIPGSFEGGMKDVGFEALDVLHVGSTPKLNTICPCWLEDSFMYIYFVIKPPPKKSLYSNF